jgi:hypothetical protein
MLLSVLRALAAPAPTATTQIAATTTAKNISKAGRLETFFTV